MITTFPKKLIIAIMALDLFLIGNSSEVSSQLLGFVSYLFCATSLICKIRAGE